MKQYMDIKNQYPDTLCLFRMGDFYETFYEDAKLAAKTLNITLTARGKGDARAPLAGIPYHALDNYLKKLVDAGIKVTIVEQLEDPKLAKGVVKRGVIRIVTPGTIIEDNMLSEKNNNFLMSIARENEKYGISIVDVSTGHFSCTKASNWDKSLNEVSKFNPKECIMPTSMEDSDEWNNLKQLGIFMNTHDDRHFWKGNAYSYLIDHFKVNSLKGFGIEGKDLCIGSAGALMNYITETQKNALEYITNIKHFTSSEYMILDSATIRNLEITKNIVDNSTKGTLLEVLDKTKTSLGARLLSQWIKQPLINTEKIEKRQNATEELKHNVILQKSLQQLLSNIADIERLFSRISYGNANPRDLIALSSSLKQIPNIKKELATAKPDILAKISRIPSLEDVQKLIENSIKEEPAVTIREGNIIKQGYNEELDKLISIKTNGKKFIADLEEQERSKTGIKSLKIKFNKVFGYYIEVTKPNLHLVPENYIRKQTQVNSERFFTDELKEQESLILGSEEKINDIEYELFIDILKKITSFTTDIQSAAKKIAVLDVLVSFAAVAAENNYTKPTIDESNIILIKDSRHPVLEKIEEMFVPNNVLLDSTNKLMIITGPNMAGKSTYMRQIALCVLMAQIGSFIPASSAVIGVVDRIFTRVGAYDDLTHGQSTFMVEMNETANILNNATDRSLIILDEIGRGTSTYDGLSIAWSVAEYIHENIKAKTIFATHYHQLNKLADHFKAIKNFSIAVKEKQDTIVFLRKIVEGGTDKSYGIHVARLAGLPEEVINRSKVIMNQLEMEDEIGERIHKELKKRGVDQAEALDKKHQKQRAEIEEKEVDKQLSLLDL